MFRKQYKVKGEDVDDFMVMENKAYHDYAVSILNTFLLENGYSKKKLDVLQVYSKETEEAFTIRKDLMFLQEFFVNLEVSNVNNSEQKLYVRNRFFNSNNELCAITTIALDLYNNNALLKVIAA